MRPARRGLLYPVNPPHPVEGRRTALWARWGTVCGMTTTVLTVRQQEVLDLWLAGTTYRDLATALGISPETVNPHLKAIAKKLGAGGISRAKLRQAVAG